MILRDKWTTLAAVLLAAAFILLALPVPRAGAENIAPQPESVAGDMRLQAEDFIASLMPDTVSRWEIEELNLPAPDRFPAEFTRVEVSSRDRSLRGDRVSLDIKFYKNSQLIKKLYGRARVAAYADVVVPGRVIDRGEVVSGSAVKLEQQKISFPVSDFCTEIAQVEGKAAERRLSEGRAIRMNEVRTPPTVKAGDRVMIVAENASLKITTRGLARTDGDLGEVIPVINLRSNKRVHARVTGRSTVQVVF